MKMTDSDYKHLERLCLDTLAKERQRWDIFNTVCDKTPGLLTRLYSYLNDNHIDTALKHIMPRRTKGED